RAVNDPPALSGLPDLAVLRIPTPLQITFSVHDLDTPVDSLTVNGYALDPILLPASNVIVTGTGPNRTVTVYPAFGRVGSTTITLVVSDGESAVSASFYILVTAASP